MLYTPRWQKPSFTLFEQSFLAMQDWWRVATEKMAGISSRDAERVQFQVRQMLDLVSPSNFPRLNPEIIAKTLEKQGRNLSDGRKKTQISQIRRCAR